MHKILLPVIALNIALAGCMMGRFLSVLALIIVTVVGLVIFVLSKDDDGATPISFLIKIAVAILLISMWITYPISTGHVGHFCQLLGNYCSAHMLRQ